MGRLSLIAKSEYVRSGWVKYLFCLKFGGNPLELPEERVTAVLERLARETIGWSKMRDDYVYAEWPWAYMENYRVGLANEASRKFWQAMALAAYFGYGPVLPYPPRSEPRPGDLVWKTYYHGVLSLTDPDELFQMAFFAVQEEYDQRAERRISSQTRYLGHFKVGSGDLWAEIPIGQFMPTIKIASPAMHYSDEFYEVPRFEVLFSTVETWRRILPGWSGVFDADDPHLLRNYLAELCRDIIRTAIGERQREEGPKELRPRELFRRVIEAIGARESRSVEFSHVGRRGPGFDKLKLSLLNNRNLLASMHGWNPVAIDGFHELCQYVGESLKNYRLAPGETIPGLVYELLWRFLNNDAKLAFK